jgi:hypothetical protein
MTALQRAMAGIRQPISGVPEKQENASRFFQTSVFIFPCITVFFLSFFGEGNIIKTD